MKNLQLWIIFNYVFNKYFIQQLLFEQLLNFVCSFKLKYLKHLHQL